MIFGGLKEHLFRKSLSKDASEYEAVIVLIALYDIGLKSDKCFNRIW